MRPILCQALLDAPSSRSPHQLCCTHHDVSVLIIFIFVALCHGITTSVQLEGADQGLRTGLTSGEPFTCLCLLYGTGRCLELFWCCVTPSSFPNPLPCLATVRCW